MDLKCKIQVAVVFVVTFAMVATKAAPVQPDHAGCTHTLHFRHLQSNRSATSSSIRSVILSTLAKGQLQNRMRNFSETSADSAKLEGMDLTLVQKLLNDISKRSQNVQRLEGVRDNQHSSTVRCGKRCRRRRRHNRRRKGQTLDSLVFRPPKTDPGILKSNNPAVVITKDTHILRKDWCKTERLEQQIREPGCRPKTIVNNFCYGQCNSFFIPNGELSDDSGKRVTNSTVPDFKSCAVCKPRLTSWIKVTLRCPGLIPPTRTKRVLRVHKCRCQTEVSR